MRRKESSGLGDRVSQGAHSGGKAKRPRGERRSSAPAQSVRTGSAPTKACEAQVQVTELAGNRYLEVMDIQVTVQG